MKKTLVSLTCIVALLLSLVVVQFGASADPAYLCLNSGLTGVSYAWAETATGTVSTDAAGMSVMTFGAEADNNFGAYWTPTPDPSYKGDFTHAYFYYKNEANPSTANNSVSISFNGGADGYFDCANLDMLPLSNVTGTWQNAAVGWFPAFEGWIRIDLANAKNGTTPLGATTAIWQYSMILNQNVSVGPVYFASSDDDVPYLGDLINQTPAPYFPLVSMTGTFAVSNEDGGTATASLDTTGDFPCAVLTSASGLSSVLGSLPLDATSTVGAYTHIYFYFKGLPGGTPMSFELDGPGNWFGLLATPKVQLLSKATPWNGWVDLTTSGGFFTVPGGFEGWVKIPVANLSSSGTTITSSHSLTQAAMWFNTFAAGDKLSMGPIGLANADADVPFLTDLLDIPAPIAGDYLTINDMTDPAKLFGSAGATTAGVTTTHGTIDGLKVSSITFPNDSAWVAGGYPVFGAPIKLSDMTHIYMFVAAPAERSAPMSFSLDGGGKWYNVLTYQVLRNDDVDSGWQNMTTTGNDMVFPAGFKGWVKADITTLKDATSGDFLDGTVSISATTSWFQNLGNTIHVGPIYAAKSDDKVPGLPANIPAVPRVKAAVIRDFDDSITAEGQSYTSLDGKKGFWGLNGAGDPLSGDVQAISSKNNVAGGTYSCRITNTYEGDRTNYTQICLVGSYMNKGSVVGKRYVAIHVTAPPADAEWKNPLRVDEYGNPLFGISFGLRVTDGSTTTYWSNKGGQFEKKAKLLKDGGSAYVDGLTQEGFVLVPFGFSGWIIYDLENFSIDGLNDPTPLDLTKLDNVFDMWISQVGKRAGDVYLDSMYAFNWDDDVGVPGMTLTQSGNSDVGYFTEYVGEEEEEDDDYDDDDDDYDYDDDDEAGGGGTSDDDEVPETGAEASAMVILVSVSAATILLLGKKKRKEAK